MATVGRILESLLELAPLELKLDFDNAGLLVGDAAVSVERVLFCLDITDEVIEEAGKKECRLIVSHHPLFFTLPNSIRADCRETAKITRLLQMGVSAICLHTNLDRAKGGVNDELCRCLELVPAGVLGEDALGRIGTLKQPMSVADFAKDVKRLLGCRGVKLYNAGRPAKRIGLVGGSGGSYLVAALSAGCDTLVTADVKHHQFLEARELHLNLIDAGHYHTERPVLSVLMQTLSSLFPELVFFPSDTLQQDEVLFL